MSNQLRTAGGAYRVATLWLSVVCAGVLTQAQDHGPRIAAVQGEKVSARLLRPEALGELARFREVAPDGSVTLLSGELASVPAPPGPASAANQAALEATTRRFIQERLTELAARAGSEAPELAFEPYVQVDRETSALHARQLWNGVEVMDSRLTFVFADRTLVTFAGRVLPPQQVLRTTTMDAGPALRALERGAAPQLPADRRIRPLAGGRFLVEDGGGRPHLGLEKVIDPETAETVWLATKGAERWTVGAGAEGRVVSRGSVRKDISYTTVQIRHGDARVGTTDWMEPLASLSPIDGPMTVHTEDVPPGFCRYSLRYDEFVSNGISPQVLDYSPGAWQSWQPVVFCIGMDFLAGPGTASRYRQQHYYWWLRRAGDHVRSRVFGTFAPLADWDVGLAVNEPTGSCGPGASACFNWNPFSRWIHLTRDASGDHPSVKTLFHEYGHYFVWAYGGLSGNCRDGDEGNALDETMGEAIALLLGKRYFDPSYGDLGNLAFLGDGSEFPLRFTPGAMGCFLSGDEHFMGRPFLQAIWQVAFGANCHDAACSADLTGIRDDIGWPSATSARDHLLKSLAYALKLLPTSATHKQVVAFMHMYFMTHTDPVLASNVMRVFQSHGF